MATQPIPKLKETFSDNKEPNGQDFANLIDSFEHKSVPIAQTRILGLQQSFDGKADNTALQQTNALVSLLDQTKASNEDLANVVGGLNPMGDAENIADLNTKPKRDKDSYYVKSEIDENGDPYIFKYDEGLADWINTKQVVYKNVAKSGGSDKTLQQVDDEKTSTYESIIKGYTETTDVDFSNADNTFINYVTSAVTNGNGIFKSVTKDVSNVRIIKYDSSIIESTSSVALIVYLDANDKRISWVEPFDSARTINNISRVPIGAVKASIAFRVGKKISVQLLSGDPIDDVVREKQLENSTKDIHKNIESVKDETVHKEYAVIGTIGQRNAQVSYVDYLTSEVKSGGNNIINSVTIDLTDDMRYVEYEAEIIESTSKFALCVFLDAEDKVISYFGAATEDKTIKGKELIPKGAVKASFAWKTGKNVSINLLGERSDNTIRKDRKHISSVSFENASNTYVNYITNAVVNSNGLFKSVTLDLTNEIALFHLKTETVITSNPIAAVTFLNSEGKVISFFVPLNVEESVDAEFLKPINASKVVFTHRTGYPISVDIYSNENVNDYLKQSVLDNKAKSTALELYNNPQKGETYIGNFRLQCNVSNPVKKTRQTHDGKVYTDINESKKQYTLINGSTKILQDGFLNKLPSEVIDFTPSDDGFTRAVVGKDSFDRFYVSYKPSRRKGVAGNQFYGKLEVTTDFEHFTTIWKGSNNPNEEGISIENYANISVSQLKELGNGNLILSATFTRLDLPATDNDGNSGANNFNGYFILSADHSTIKQCTYTDFNNEVKPMNATHLVLPNTDYYSNQGMYDWSVFVYQNKVVATEYGDKKNAGIVWYSEDFGENFKQVFWMPNHYNDGVTNGDNVTETHIHGVTYDYYRNRIYIISGEQNRNLFWSDKGLDTTDADWNVENIRTQNGGFPQFTYMQIVNGYPFRDCMIYGSDFLNVGALLRINRTADDTNQKIEIAHEIHPQLYAGTLYCAGGITHKDQNSPVLMCVTRENAMSTPEQQREHFRQHLSRVIATYDGFNFFEIWLDDTFGTYEVYNAKTNVMENREIAKCTRDMNAWLCENGDLIIKYSGRDFTYMTADYSEVVYSNISAQVVRYKNVGRFL